MTTHDQVGASFAVLDLETTGFSHSDRIVEIGVVLCDPAGAVEGAWDSLVQPERDIPNSGIHGITATDVVGAPRFAEIAGDLAGLLAGRVLVAHNARFDARFLLEEFGRAGFPVGAAAGDVLDSMGLARRLLPGAPRRLADCVSVLGLHNEWAHCALGDAAVTAELLRNLVALMSPAELASLHALRGFGSWPVPACSGRSLSRTGGLEALVSGASGPEREERAAGSWIDRIVAELPESTDADVAAYRRLLTAALVDDRLSASEIEQLVATAAHHGLDRDDVAEIHRRFLRQLAVSAWADGNVDAAERDQMLTVAGQLGVPRAEIEPLLEAPVAGEAAARLVLHHGDRVTFTGRFDLPREQWEARAGASGLVVAGIARRTVVLVAGNPDSMSGKARRARELGVPIVDEATFATFLRELDAGAAVQKTAVAWPVATLDWPGFDGPVSGSVPELAELWLSRCTDRPLSSLSPALDPAHLPEVVVQGSPVALRWLSGFPVPLDASVAEVSALHGVGKVKLRAIVECLVQEAVDTGGAA